MISVSELYKRVRKTLAVLYPGIGLTISWVIAGSGNELLALVTASFAVGWAYGIAMHFEPANLEG